MPIRHSCHHPIDFGHGSFDDKSDTASHPHPELSFPPTPPRNLKMTTSPSLISKTSSSRGKSRNVSATPKPAKAKLSSPALRSTDSLHKPSSKSASPANSLSSPSMHSDHLCAHCGSSSVQIKHVTRSFGKGSSLLVIEAIPLHDCPNCGESYFSAQTLHEIERIKALRKSVAVSRPIPVAAFQAAA